MASTSIVFAWALPVKVEVLGAHLEAYQALLPTLIAVRLCNRYGKGSKAHITKLPIEMIHHIEGFLFRTTRATTLPQWGQDLRCWEEKCQPIDHMDDATILEIYNRSKRDWTPGGVDFEDYDNWQAEWKEMIAPSQEVTPGIRESVADTMNEHWSDDGDRWTEDGEPRGCLGQARWCARVGHPTSLERGKFDQYRVILRKDFGLDIFVSHVQLNEKSVRNADSTAHSTIAYLRLPDATGCAHVHVPDLYENDYRMAREKSEAGGARTLKLPSTPSEKSLARFDHAMQALALEVQETSEGNNQAHEGLLGGGGMWTSSEAMPVLKVKSGTKPSEQAKLTMFTLSKDDNDW